MAPVGAWVAASGTMAVDPWILFLVIFLWTPPHFWALALVYKDDYRVARLPMMPVVKGDDSTFRQIIVYSWLLVISSLFMIISPNIGPLYLGAAFFLGYLFLKKSRKASKIRSEREIRSLFGYSIIYLFALFIVIVIDGVI
jgi:protoheme IX farnesyltransferase